MRVGKGSITIPNFPSASCADGFWTFSRRLLRCFLGENTSADRTDLSTGPESATTQPRARLRLARWWTSNPRRLSSCRRWQTSSWPARMGPGKQKTKRRMISISPAAGLQGELSIEPRFLGLLYGVTSACCNEQDACLRLDGPFHTRRSHRPPRGWSSASAQSRTKWWTPQVLARVWCGHESGPIHPPTTRLDFYPIP